MSYGALPSGLRPEDVKKPDRRDAEIARLRALVEAAYREGFADGAAAGGGIDRRWKDSAARLELDPA